MAFVFAGALELLAVATEAIGTSVGFATGSDLVGGAAANAFKGAVIGAATDTVKNGAYSAADYLGGQGSVDQAKEVGKDVFWYNSSIGHNSSSSGSFGVSGGGTGSKETPDEWRKRQASAPSSVVPKDPVSYDYVPPSVFQQTDYRSATAPIVNNSGFNFKTSDESDYSSALIPPSVPVMVDTKGPSLLDFMNGVNNVSPYVDNNALTLDNAKALGKEVGGLIAAHTVEMVENNVPAEQALINVVQKNPQYKKLIPTILDYQAKAKGLTPNTNAYKEISRTYNGASMSTKSVRVTTNPDTGLKIFMGLDELQKTWFYKQNPDAFVVPPIYGVWVGINSPNNELPVSLLDVFAYFHDCEYHANMFDINADYRLISRIVQNWDRLTEAEKPAAFIAIKYFSTIGHTVAGYKNMFFGNNNAPEADFTNLFDDLVSDNVLDVNNDIIDYNQAEEYFNEGLDEGLVEYLSVSSSLGNPTLYQNAALSYYINQIEVEIV